jgi:hypothetical protein
MNIRSGLLFLLFNLFVNVLFAQPWRDGQNYTCETASPFCTGTQYAFPAGVNAGYGQPGPCYDCLINTPNPAWYYLKVANPGNLIIEMQSEPPRDIDFCAWGPFNNLNCCDQLFCYKVVSCSYGGSSAETCTIPNGLSGQYYMFVITNISNLPCNIIFTQTGGTGTTDCTILPPPCSNNSPICVGQTLQLNAASVLSATYHWSGPDGFSSGAQNPAIPDAQLINAGDYYLHLTINGIPDNDSSKTTAYIYQPVADAGNDTIIQNGVFTTLHGSASQGSGSYQYHWEPANLLIDPDIASPTTVNLFSTTLFTVTATDNAANCDVQDMVTVFVAGGALAVNAVAIPLTICSGQTTQLQSFGSGGTGNYTYSWSGPGGFISNLQNPSVQPPVTSTYTIMVNDGFNTASNTVTVNVDQLPVADPGVNQSIPNGTYTFLDGSVTGGTSNYFFSWAPTDKLINPNVQQPQTTILTATTVYSLTVTDLVTNCVSNNPANVSIEVTGGPLNANPVATPGWICRGDTAQLHASAGGGNVGYYQYEWNSNPSGFSSSEAEPYVYPVENTTYTVTVFDGFTYTNGSVSVSIYPEPVIILGPPDTTICIYDTLQLDAGNPGDEYLWSNGATSRFISVQGAGIVPEIQSYQVKVTNEDGCSSISSISILYSYSACTGINIRGECKQVNIYPNPSNGIFTLVHRGPSDDIRVSITNILGKTLKTLILRKSESGCTSETLDLSGYPKGMYFIEFGNNSQLWTEKLVIE